MSSAVLEESTAVTACLREANSSVWRPVPQAKSSAGPSGSSGSNPKTKPAGSPGGPTAVARCLASHSDVLAGIKKAPERDVQEPENLSRRKSPRQSKLNAERATAAASALHVRIIELESRT